MMPKRKDRSKILILGSGPIIVGQSAEFYSVPQGLKPIAIGVVAGAPEGAPFQNDIDPQVSIEHDPVEPCHDKAKISATRAATFPSKNKIA